MTAPATRAELRAELVELGAVSIASDERFEAKYVDRGGRWRVSVRTREHLFPSTLTRWTDFGTCDGATEEEATGRLLRLAREGFNARRST